MNIQKYKIKGFDNEPIKFNDVPYPQPKKNTGLPRMFFTCLAIGSTGSGKTFSVCKLLKYYEKLKIYNGKDEVPQRIILISPTTEANPIYKTLKNLDEDDIYTNYSDDLLNEIIEDIKYTKEEAEKYQSDVELIKKFNKTNSLRKFDNDEIIRLEILNYEFPPLKPKYDRPPVNHFILDDLLASPGAFKPNGNSPISNLCVKNRHLMSNVFILGQTSNQIPKIIRTQARLLLLYRFNSNKITQDLYEVVSSILSPEEFENLYDKCTDRKYNFLCVDNTQKNVLLKQNFNYLIKLNSKK